MTATQRAWLPTSTGQSATVVALTVMLLLNLTVLLLLVSGELAVMSTSGGSGFAEAWEGKRERPTDASQSQSPAEQDADAGVTTRPSGRPAITRISDPPAGLAADTSEPAATTPKPPASSERPAGLADPTRPGVSIEPPADEEQNGPPLEFFGLPLE